MARSEPTAAAYRSFIVNECLRLGVPESDMPEWTPFNLLVERLESACQASSWQPMKTAPRDGREILLLVEIRAGIRHKMLVGHYMPGGHCIEDHPAIDEGWYFWNGCMFDKASKPTHWMPLPTPPRSPRHARPRNDERPRSGRDSEREPMTPKETLDELERLTTEVSKDWSADNIVIRSSLPSLIADSRKLADAMTFVPLPQSMSGYGDPEAPDEVKALIALAAKLHDIDQPYLKPITSAVTKGE